MGKELRSTNSDKRSSNATKGFASNSPVQQRYVSSKGGRVKTKKGLGAMPPDKARKIQSMGGKKKWENIKIKEKNGKDSIPSGDESNGS